MDSSLALLLWFVLVLALLRFDPAKSTGTSWVLWVPVAWMFFMQSRQPSQWLGRTMVSQAEAFENGNALDRAVLLGLILASVGILMARSFRWGDFFARNFFLTAILFFGLVSFLWSDFPYIAFKRWVRDLGNYLAILIVLSEAHRLEAVRVFLRRLYYALIPLSILMIKYYAREAIFYNGWTGLPEYVGAASSKNTLGATCMLSGIFFFWDTVARWSDRKERRTKRILLVNVAFILMSLWLLRLSNSKTSLVCLMLGWGVILAYYRWSRHHPGFLKMAIPCFFCGYLILAYGFGVNDALAGALGRDSSFTGRTNIWAAVLSTDTNPIIGTGYDSFWLGDRLNEVWQLAGGVNHAHNGYIEFYLNLGFVGLFLLAGLLISSYRTIWKSLSQSPALASLAVTLWAIALFYNITEAAFKPAFMSLTFLLGAIIIPEQRLLEAPRKFLNSRGWAPAARSRTVRTWAQSRPIASVKKPQAGS